MAASVHCHRSMVYRSNYCAVVDMEWLSGNGFSGAIRSQHRQAVAIVKPRAGMLKGINDAGRGSRA